MAQKKAVSEGSAQKNAQVKEEEDTRPVRNIHKHAEKELRRTFRKVCGALLTKAEEGSLAELRLLLQIAQSDSGKTCKRTGGAGRSLGEILLSELKRRQDEREAAAADTDLARGDVAQTGAESDSEAEGA